MFHLPRPHLSLPLRRKGKTVRTDDLGFSRGQIIVLFAAALMVLIGILGIAIDVSYAWVQEMRMQRAADAAALAGAVYLPDDPAGGTAASIASAKQNGYSGGVNHVTITAVQNTPNHEQMDVTITAQVPTFFMQVFGITSLTPSRTSHAQFHLPVPMGSPLNVFGDPTATDLNGNALNFWAAIQGPCTLKENGDPYATKDTTTVHQNCNSVTASNSEYKGPAGGDPGAYNYAVKIPSGSSGNLVIQLYDPQYCARSDNNQDAGDFDFQYNGGQKSFFSTTFTLYNPSDTPYDLTDDTVNTSVTYPGDGSTSSTNPSTHSCSSYYGTSGGTGVFTGKWITFATIAGASGTYRLNVGTTATGSTYSNGSNQFGIRATLNGGPGPEVFAGVVGAESAMSIFNNLASGTSYIYLAQISAACAGKTMEVDLFDPGDLNGTGVMYFEMPNGGSYSDATFTWRDSGTNLTSTGTQSASTTSVTTATGGSSHFNGHWLVVTIKIPSSYTASLNGWWKVKYVITGGAAHDRTTWRVEIRDSPVHLVG
jgi:hypothetical protein